MSSFNQWLNSKLSDETKEKMIAAAGMDPKYIRKDRPQPYDNQLEAAGISAFSPMKGLLSGRAGPGQIRISGPRRHGYISGLMSGGFRGNIR